MPIERNNRARNSMKKNLSLGLINMKDNLAKPLNYFKIIIIIISLGR